MMEVTSWSDLLSFNLLVGIWAYGATMSAIALYLAFREFVWWRLKKKYTRFRHPERYDKELHDFLYYMRGRGDWGIWIGNSSDNMVIDNVFIS